MFSEGGCEPPPPNPAFSGLLRIASSLASKADSLSRPSISNSIIASIAISIPEFCYTLPLKDFLEVERPHRFHQIGNEGSMLPIGSAVINVVDELNDTIAVCDVSSKFNAAFIVVSQPFSMEGNT